MNLWHKIKLYRKAFLTQYYRLSYSQFGEDIVLGELVKKDVDKGFYVDIGCFHPKKFSNTYMLYKRGWRGINIDLEADKIYIFNLLRPDDCNIQAAVSDKKEKVILYRYSTFGVGSTISHSQASITSEKVFDKQRVETQRINDILDKSIYRDRTIDLLSIDIEGMDYKVLSSIDFNIYQPKIIIIESHLTSIGEVLQSDIYLFLEKKGYVLRSWTFYSLIFIFPDSDILKDREKSAKKE